MVILQSVWEEMVRHAREAFPNEACGLVAVRAGVASKTYRTANADESPVSYRIDPQDQLRATLEIEDGGDEIGIIYHSHTRTRAYPSPTDIRNAFDPGPLYAIVSLANPRTPELRGYWIRDGKVEEEPIEVLPDAVESI